MSCCMNRIVDNTKTLCFIKFLLVGVINTSLTFLIYALLRFWGIIPEVCNIIGYVVGVINSFLWNKKWVFKTSETNVFREFACFVFVFAVCYTMQFWAFTTMLYRFQLNDYVAQISGMIIYTSLNYVLNSYFSFRNK